MAFSSQFLDRLSKLSLIEILLICFFATLVSLLAYCIYNLYFHPLAGFPGPRTAAVSPIWAMSRWVSGRYIHSVKDLHDEYGTVVRTAPNQLSFCSSRSWKDIHGHIPGRKVFAKGTFYEPLPGEAYDIVSVSNTHHHAAMRKSLSYGFSANALSQQEDLVQNFVDLLISQIARNCCNSADDMTKWYNFATFEAIGVLAFGEGFGSLESGKPHFWINILFDGIKSTNFLRCFEYLPPIRSLFRKLYEADLLPRRVTEPRRRQLQYAHDKIQRRLLNKPPRPDFLTRMISEGQNSETNFEGLRSQASLLVIAGSETTATALSAITYYLCRTPKVYHKLAEEVRSTFSSYAHVTGQSTQALPYLKAVIEEGLRIYPPLPAGLPRISPGETVDGVFVPKGTIVSVSSWAATHYENNFHDPFTFLPERWLDAECTDDKGASQPFLLGSRGCLGRNLANLELQLILAKIIWTFDFEMGPEGPDWMAESKAYGFWQKPNLPVRFRCRPEAEGEVAKLNEQFISRSS